MNNDSEKHFVQRYVFDVDVGEQENAHRIQSKLSDLFNHSIVSILEKVLNEFDDPDYVVKIDQITLDLGAFTEGDLVNELPYQFERHFRSIVRELIGDIDYTRNADVRPATKIAVNPARLEIVRYYFKHGRLPAGGERLGETMEEMLRIAMEEAPAEAGVMIRKAIEESSATSRRIVRQFSGATVREIYKVLAPAHAMFLVSQETSLLIEVAAAMQANPRSVRETVVEAILRSVAKEGEVFSVQSFRRRVIENIAKVFGTAVQQAFEEEVSTLGLRQEAGEEEATSVAVIRKVLQEGPRAEPASKVVVA
ncbi:MAG: contractile injection system tape measure protein, partial [Bacteroidota bacterium]